MTLAANVHLAEGQLQCLRSTLNIVVVVVVVVAVVAVTTADILYPEDRHCPLDY